MNLFFIIGGSIIILLLFLLLVALSNIYTKITVFSEVKDFENRTKLYNLYTDLDLVAIENTIDAVINNYINRWVLVNITAKGDNYIKDNEVEELIKYVTSTFTMEMSDVHLFYIKCLTSIDTDEDLIAYVRNKVKFLVLDYITEFNNIQ
jgi:hypothetical protein